MDFLHIGSHDEDRINIIRLLLKDLDKLYPDIIYWYDNKVVPILNFRRDIVMAYDNGIFVGFFILKKVNRKCTKICTFKVLDLGKGYGLDMMSYIFSIVENSDIFITISEENLEYFENILNIFRFVMIDSIKDKYRKNKIEYVFERKYIS